MHLQVELNVTCLSFDIETNVNLVDFFFQRNLCRMMLTFQSLVVFQICLPSLLLWYLLESTARAPSPPSIWNQQKDQWELEVAQCGWKKLLLGEGQARERGIGPGKSSFWQFFAMWRERHLTAYTALCVGESFNWRFQFVFLLRTAYKEAVCEATVSCFCLLFSQGIISRRIYLVPADEDGSYFCFMSSGWLMVKWIIKPGLRGILQALPCGEIPSKLLQETI